MTQPTKPTKRIAIYSFSDPDGIVDDYVLYQLQELRKHAETILFAAVGDITSQSKEAVAKSANHILQIDKTEAELIPYQKGIEFLGQNTLMQYDELVLMNDSMYGPVYPLEEAFSWAETSGADFWGMVRHYYYGNEIFFAVTQYNSIPEHISHSFFVIRKSLLHTEDHATFWNTLSDLDDTSSTFLYHNPTKYFEKKGYVSAAYVDTKYLENIYAEPLRYAAAELIQKKQYPFFARQLFLSGEVSDFTSHTFGEQTVEVIRIVENQTSYKMEWVWQNALRLANLADLHRNAQLNRVLPKHAATSTESPKLKTLLVVHSYYEDYIGYILSYIVNMPSYCDILITTPFEKSKEIILTEAKKRGIPNKLFVEIIENRGRDISALLIGAKRYVFGYDLVFFLHDKKSGSYLTPPSIGISWQKKCFENLLGSTIYIENILHMFEKEPRLGLAFPPPPYCPQNHFKKFMGTEWSDSFEPSAKLLKEFNIHLPLSKKAPPICPFGTMFVFRPQALRQLFNGLSGNGWKYTNFPKEPTPSDATILHAIERTYQYFAQNAGYYVAWLVNDEWASIELGNYYSGWSITDCEFKQYQSDNDSSKERKSHE